MAKDPLCGMDVDEAGAAGSSTHKGKTYCFCAAACKQEFHSNPEKHAKKG